MRSPLTEPLLQLAEAWRSVTRASRFRAAVSVVALAWVLALLLARHGTLRTRIAAGVAIVLSALLAFGWRLLERRRLRDPGRIVRGLARAVDPERAERALRALSLIGPAGDVRAEGTSAELARLHVSRALEQLPSNRIVERAAAVAGRVGLAALVVGDLRPRHRPRERLVGPRGGRRPRRTPWRGARGHSMARRDRGRRPPARLPASVRTARRGALSADAPLRDARHGAGRPLAPRPAAAAQRRHDRAPVRRGRRRRGRRALAADAEHEPPRRRALRRRRRPRAGRARRSSRSPTRRRS